MIFRKIKWPSFSFFSKKMVIDTFCYGPVEQENARSLDLYTSPKANENTPLVIFIHGGAWRTEDKSDYKTLAMDCLSLGISVVSVNYRQDSLYILCIKQTDTCA